MRTDTSGKTKFLKTYGASASKGYSIGAGHAFEPLSAGGFITMGTEQDFGSGGLDVYMVKMDSSINTNSCDIKSESYSLSIYSISDHSYSFSTKSFSPTIGKGVTVNSQTFKDSMFCAPFIANFQWQNPCAGQSAKFYDSSYYQATSWKWNFGDAGSSSNTSSSQNPVHIYKSSGSYTVKLVSSNGTVTDSIVKTINVYSSPAQASTTKKTICPGDSFNLKASGGVSYLWNNTSLVSDSTASSAWAYPYQSTTFIAKVTNSNGCSVWDSVKITVDTSSSCTKISNISGVINNYASVSAYDTCMNSVTVDTSSFFKVGSKALLIQMAGASIDTTNTSSFGSIKNIGNAGNYEYVTVDSINGKTIYFKYALANKYDVAGLMQLVTIPQYGNVIISKALTCQPWNGKKYGVLIFEAAGAVYQTADADVSYKGFRGGSPSSSTNGCHKSDYYYASGSNSGAGKGEGIAVGKSSLTNGRGAFANGGGGGNSESSGGGGGGNYSQGGVGGKEIDLCSTPIANGGVGGLGLSTYINKNRIFLGGGGGAGSGSSFTRNGVAGGGIILIKANKLITVGNIIKANGASQTYNTTTDNDGDGGGGAAGTIDINLQTLISKVNVQLNGGNGGNVNYDECSGPGGGGSGGALVLNTATLSSKVLCSVKPGISGIEKYNGNCANSPYGADSGRSGGIVTGITTPQSTTLFTRHRVVISTKYKKICAGDSVQLSAAGAVKYAWTPTTNLSDSTISNPYAFPTAKTLYTITGYQANGCTTIDTVTINVDTSCFKGKRIGGYINNYAAVSVFDTCFNFLTVDKTSYFKVGDKALLIQMKGALIDTSNSSTFGAISKINSAGAYEYVTIDSIGGSDLYLRYKTLRYYDAGAGLQIVTIPQYTDVMIKTPLKATGWNGSKGGVLVFEATGKVIMLANIDATGKGFSGGARSTGTANCGASNYYYSSSNGDGANKGEGIVVTHTGWAHGKGPSANGGGGG
ncbi:MAG: PKD domain-containing protein, partial [Legionellales bacterium]